MLDISAMVKEFEEFELDPGKVNTARLYDSIGKIRETLNLSNLTACEMAHSAVASLWPIINFKAARCGYWRDVLKNELVKVRLQKKFEITKRHKEEGDAERLTKELLDDQIESSEEVATLLNRYASSSASCKFWETILESYKEIGKRIDGAGMNLGTEGRIKIGVVPSETPRMGSH
jgi:hypothetical protein